MGDDDFLLDGKSRKADTLWVSAFALSMNLIIEEGELISV